MGGLGWAKYHNKVVYYDPVRLGSVCNFIKKSMTTNIKHTSHGPSQELVY